MGQWPIRGIGSVTVPALGLIAYSCLGNGRCCDRRDGCMEALPCTGGTLDGRSCSAKTTRIPYSTCVGIEDENANCEDGPREHCAVRDFYWDTQVCAGSPDSVFFYTEPGCKATPDLSACAKESPGPLTRR